MANNHEAALLSVCAWWRVFVDVVCVHGGGCLWMLSAWVCGLTAWRSAEQKSKMCVGRLLSKH
eukprot:1329318-Amorphochlora_amoeboformis.AAC.1